MDRPPFPVERRDQIITGHEYRLNQIDQDIRDLRAMTYGLGFSILLIGILALFLP